jgi:hypothetical protein
MWGRPGTAYRRACRSGAGAGGSAGAGAGGGGGGGTRAIKSWIKSELILRFLNLDLESWTMLLAVVHVVFVVVVC